MKSIIDYINEYKHSRDHDRSSYVLTIDPVLNIPVYTYTDTRYNKRIYIEGNVHIENCVLKNFDIVLANGIKCIFDDFITVTKLNMHSIKCTSLPTYMNIENELIFSPYSIEKFPDLLICSGVMYDNLTLNSVLNLASILDDELSIFKI